MSCLKDALFVNGVSMASDVLYENEKPIGYKVDGVINSLIFSKDNNYLCIFLYFSHGYVRHLQVYDTISL